MKKLEKYKGKLVEWMVFTLTCFFLYDVIWAVADYEDFKRNLEEYTTGLLMDLACCGIFSLASLTANHILLRQRFFQLAETDRRRFFGAVAVIVAVNILLAGACDLLLSCLQPDFMEDDVWGTFFLFGIIASLLTLIHLLLHYSEVMIRRNKEILSLQQKYRKLLLDSTSEEVHSKLDSLLDEAHQYRERFLVSKGDELVMLYTDNISFVSKTDSRVLAVTADGTSYPLAMSMADLKQALDPDRFFRINRQYIANIKGIQKISLFFSSKLLVKLKGCDDDNIVISKEKTAQFKKWLDR